MRIALVTGAGSGIGRASVIALARDGFSVVVAGRQAAPLEETAERCRQAGAEALAVPVDVTDPMSVDVLYATIGDRFGRLDLLFNNAGRGAPPASVGDLPIEVWREVVDTNLTGAFLMAQLAARSMAAAGGGAIVHNASIDASGGDGPFAAYNASKAALLGLSRTMALELAEHGIRSNCVSPGFTHTDMTEKAVGPELMSYLNGQFARVPMKRLVRTDEVANAILFLASDDASAITGTNLTVDCGLTANWFILETLPEG